MPGDTLKYVSVLLIIICSHLNLRGYNYCSYFYLHYRLVGVMFWSVFVSLLAE